VSLICDAVPTCFPFLDSPIEFILKVAELSQNHELYDHLPSPSTGELVLPVLSAVEVSEAEGGSGGGDSILLTISVAPTTSKC